MVCKVCNSQNVQSFSGELTITMGNVAGLNTTPVYICQKVLSCLDCGFTELTIAPNELETLKKRGARASP